MSFYKCSIRLLFKAAVDPLSSSKIFAQTPPKMTSRLMALYGKKQRWYCLLKDTTKKLPYENTISKN